MAKCIKGDNFRLRETLSLRVYALFWYYKNQYILLSLVARNFLAISASICSYFCERVKMMRNLNKKTRHRKSMLIVRNLKRPLH